MYGIRRIRVVAMAVAALACALPAEAQTIAYDTSFYGGLSYDNVGPVRGGRSIGVAGSASRPLEYWFGATGGGLWKTTDGGTTWNVMTDGKITSSSVGAVAVCEADPDVVYLGMGEVQLRGNIMQGDGVYKSTDGGATWTHLGLAETQTIGRIRVHPTNCDRVFVGALGHPYGANEERGVFRSNDGGGTWTKVLFRDGNSGAVDLTMDPSNPDVLFAGFWQVNRTSWGLYSGGPGSGLFKTTDGGDTWTELTRNPGLPTTIWGKVGVSVSGADGNRVWAIIEADEGGVFRSDDGGATWERTNDERKLRQRAFYYTRIFADPVDRDVVYALNTGMYRSEDGGKTFPRSFRVPHGDNHDLWIAPNDNRRMINSNDGGGNVSFNGGETWTEQDFATAQLYHITTSNHVPYWVCGAQQDNSTACVASSGWQQMADMVSVGGGESGYIANDPENANIFYAGSYGGALTRYDYATGTSEVINVWPENPMGHSSEDIRERFQWTYPIVFSRTGPKRLYTGSQHLWMSTTEGKSWTRISPDLTRADPETMGPSGGPITKDQTGVETFATLFAIAPSPHDGNTIWTGSDDGYVQITRDHGTTWKNVTPPGMPEFARISLVEVSPHRPGTAYVAAKRYQLDDRAPYAYRTDDYGETWTTIVDGIGPGDYVHAIREDPVRPYLLFAGTEHGIHISFDDGRSWHDFRRNLPDVQVADLVLKDNDLVIGTHGRSAYIMRDISRLRQLDATIAAAPLHVFDPVDVRRDLDNNVTVSYWLKQDVPKVTVEFLDAQGSVLRTMESRARQPRGEGGGGAGRAGEEAADPDGPPRRFGGGGGAVSADAGMGRITWNMRLDGPTSFDNMILWAAGSNGPLVLPGSYQVRVTAEGFQPQTQTFEIGMDPRFPNITMAELRKQYELAVQVTERTSQANETVIEIRDLKDQVDDRIGRDGSVATQGETLKGTLTGVEGELYQYQNQSNQDPLNYPIKLNNKLAALLGAVERVNGEPTAQAYEVFGELSQRLEVEMQRYRMVLERDVEEFNRLLREKGLDPIVRKPARDRAVT